MKANQKFLNQRDEAVSPVIAVILMVAITVVLAATVYVWVSGFGAQSGTPEKSMSLSSAGVIYSCDTGKFCKQFTVAGATSGMKYSDIKFTIAGTQYAFTATCVPGAVNSYSVCQGATPDATTASLVSAGDVVTYESTASNSGNQLLVLDANANSILLKLTIS